MTTFRAPLPSDTPARPLLGIGCCIRELEGEAIHRVIDRYVRAAANHCAADVVLVPALGDHPAADGLWRKLDGLLLTGSTSNMQPALYGGPPVAGPFDPARDETSLRLARWMIDAGKPVFGICRGFQELNVLFGGTLCELPAGPVGHHAPDGVSLERMFAQTHAVNLAADGLLARSWGTRRALVNSVHFQGIEQLGSGLEIEASAEDGLIEAFGTGSGAGRVLAVQWHPEWDADSNPQARWFFNALGAAMRGEEPAALAEAEPTQAI